MEGNNQSQNIPQLCRKGCGFFGSPSFDGLCSKCHRDMNTSTQQHQQQSQQHEAANRITIGSLNQTEGVSPLVSKLASTSGLRASSIQSNVCSLPVDDESGDTLEAAAAESQSEVDAASAKKKNRCDQCTKKVGLTGFNCRCGGVFCSLHRYSDVHSCTFNYKETGQEAIRRANPQVLCHKINKI